MLCMSNICDVYGTYFKCMQLYAMRCDMTDATPTNLIMPIFKNVIPKSDIITAT